MTVQQSPPRKAGDQLILAQAHRQVQTFFDELKNRTHNYRTIASLDDQVAQAYRGRCILELLQNAHDALEAAPAGDLRQISFQLKTSPEPELLVANTGLPFTPENFEGLCQLGHSPKDPNESVGNKGLGFRSVLEVTGSPEIWSTVPPGSEMSFVFGFTPSVSDVVAEAAREIEERGLDARSPFDTGRRLLDWSETQLGMYLERMSEAGLDAALEARNYLSPHLIPVILPTESPTPNVENLLKEGHVTVIRLPLDGGKAGERDEAINSIREQLLCLNAQSSVFLSHVKHLVIDIDGDRQVLERLADPNAQLSSASHFQRQRLVIATSGSTHDDKPARQFQVWTRAFGGEDHAQTDQIRAVVEHLPNRWPEVRRFTLGIAVEQTPEPSDGVFVIFLPTEMKTGTGALINAPFFGSLDRRHIDFHHVPYNRLLLDSLLDLCLDAVLDLVSAAPEAFRGRAVVDLLASTASVNGEDWCLMDALVTRASERGIALESHPIILCDHGWSLPTNARQMPEVAGDTPIDVNHWRAEARFAIVSEVLASRHSSVDALIERLDGSPNPTTEEWRHTLDQVAMSVQNREIDASWNAYLGSVMAVLPEGMLSEPETGTPDPLANARFLPDQDGCLISPTDPVKLFFRPVRGVDDAAEYAGDVPASLKPHIAFLHSSVETQQGPQRRNTPIHKFLDGRFARSFRREDILREIVLEALPSLPAPHCSDDASLCSELLAWTLDLVGEGPLDTLLLLLGRLPVACHGGWYPMHEAIFGPGWPGRHGDDVRALADQLDEIASAQLRDPTMLRPDDPRWGIPVEDRNEFFARAGVVDGLRLHPTPDIHFHMRGSEYELPSTPPEGTSQEPWDDWRSAVREEAKPKFSGWFPYSLSGVSLLPEIHHLDKFSQRGRKAFSRLLLASLPNWPDGWHEAKIRKQNGERWTIPITSPLRHWLTSQAWLADEKALERPLSQRWLVPESLLRGHKDRFRHLSPLALDLSRRLTVDPALQNVLTMLGLNTYPLENDRIGPELLEALAAAWVSGSVPPALFDVFLGQVRDAWKHLDPEQGLPETFLVRTERRSFTTCRQDGLVGSYLPDNLERTRMLREHGKRILEMGPMDARRIAETFLTDSGVRRSSTLEKRYVVDGALWTGAADNLLSLQDSAYKWIPPTILAIAAQGGAEPTGSATRGWISATERLRHAHVFECSHIAAQLVDGDEVVAESEPVAEWLPNDVLAIRFDMESYEDLAHAAQDMLHRQDLLKDLRLVLGSISNENNPTLESIEAALARAEIDAEAFADVRNRWAGTISLLADRIRPVVSLLGLSSNDFDTAAIDVDGMTEWLTANIEQWDRSDLIQTAGRSRDDHAMGLAAWRKLGDVAQLPAWNDSLTMLGDRYSAVENRHAKDQSAAHIEDATWYLRCLARHAAIQNKSAALFLKMETLNRNFQPLIGPSSRTTR